MPVVRNALFLRDVRGLTAPLALAWTASMCATAIVSASVDDEARHLVGLTRLWARTLLRIARVSLAVEHTATVEWNAPLVLMANHRSSFDPAVLYAALPKPFGMIAKDELFQWPLLGGTMRALGCVPIDRSSPRRSLISLRAAADAVRNGTPLVVFPEGTRGRGRTLQELKPGPFHLVEMAGAAVLPIGISGTDAVLPPGGRALSPGEVTVRIGAPIPMQGKGPAARERLRQEVTVALGRLVEEASAEPLW